MLKQDGKLDNPAVFESRLQLRPSDMDYNGHVHHSHYLDLLLAARHDQMQRCYKMGMDEFVERGLSWVVRSYKIEYKRSLSLGDFATVHTWVEGIGDPGRGRRARSLVTIGFKVLINDTGKVAAHGTANYVLVEIATGKPVNIPDDVIEIYSVRADRE